MTLVDRPLIQYAIDEARAAGIRDFIFVTARGKSALEDYFDSAPELESILRRDNKHALLDELKASSMDSGAIAYIRQDKPLGLGHAVWCARRLIGDEPFAVILPDDVIAAEKPCLQQMVEAYEEVGGNIVAAMDVPHAQTSSYGILDAQPNGGRLVKVKGMVEKPDPADAPSDLAVIGRYILMPDILRNLSHLKRGSGGELQLTDAIAEELVHGRPVHAFKFEGRRYDCGSKPGFLQATVAFGLARDDLRDEFSHYIQEVAAGRLAAQ